MNEMLKAAATEDPRHAFAEAAYRIIAKRGFADTTLFEVAGEAGFSIGALTHYMKNKDELLLAAYNYVAAQCASEISDETQNHSGLEAVRRLLHWQIALDAQKMDYWTIQFIVWERARENAELISVMREETLIWWARLESFLQKAKRDKEISAKVNIKKAAKGATALLQGLGAIAVMSGHKTSLVRGDEIIDDWIEITLKPTRPLLLV